MISWRKLRTEDFTLLGRWLAAPHVARWWNHETNPAAVHRDFAPTARGEEPAEDLLVHVDERPVALVQRCKLADYAEDFEPLAALVDVPSGALTIDYLIGDSTLTGTGLGPRIIAAVVEQSWEAYPHAPAIIVGVVAANRASWRALEKAGAARIGTGEMEPDNPIDDRLHYIYRFDRPPRQAS